MTGDQALAFHQQYQAPRCVIRAATEEDARLEAMKHPDHQLGKNGCVSMEIRNYHRSDLWMVTFRYDLTKRTEW